MIYRLWTVLVFCTIMSDLGATEAKDNRERSFQLFSEGKSLYRSGKYDKAVSIFIKSLRFVQDHQTMYYKALAVSKIEKRACEDKVSCWQNYLDFCNTDKDSNCASSWLNKAENHHKRLTSKCSLEEVSPTKKSIDQKGSSNHQAMRMNTSFQCRIRNDRGSFKTQRICNGEYFQEDDQVRFEITPAQDGFLYILLHNDSGQIQLVYPEPQTDNSLRSNQTYKVPSDPYFKGWWSVDDQKDVKERITIIFSMEKDANLEVMRGIDLKPEQAKAYLRSDKVKTRSLKSWKDQGSSAIVKGKGISVESVGDSKRVITQYFFNHE